MTGITPRILLFTALWGPVAGLTEPVFPTPGTDLLGRLLETIELEQSRNGPTSQALIEPLGALISLYQASGEYRLAAATTERALQVVRANYGVHSLEQIPLMRRAILNDEAVGAFASAWDLEQQLLELVRRHPDDLRTVAVLREIAGARMDLLDRYTAGESLPQIVLGCYYAKAPGIGARPGRCTSGSRRNAIRALLADAQGMYLEAVGTIRRHEQYDSTALRELELEMVRTTYRYRSYIAEPALYEFGRERLRHLVEYDERSSAPWENRIDALIRLADWDLMFSHNSLALDAYEQIYGQLVQGDIARALMQDAFSPATPVVLPSFLPNPLESAETETSTGHIDVRFEITRFGIGRKIEILDTTSNASDMSRDRLVRLISESRFRPIVTDGEIAHKTAIVMRYYTDG